MNRALCGAENVPGILRWLKSGELFKGRVLQTTSAYPCWKAQERSISTKNYALQRRASTRPVRQCYHSPADGGSLKLFHLLVPAIPS